MRILDFRVRPGDKARALEHYQGLASAYDEEVSRGPLKYLRRRERRLVLELSGLSRPTRPLRMLDVGCGGGYYSLRAKRSGYYVHAVDISPGMINRIRPYVDRATVSDVEFFSTKEKYDLVLCCGVLDFVVDPERAFARLAACVRPGGKLVILAPSVGAFGLVYRLEKRVLSGIAVNLFSPRWIKEQGRMHGLRVEKIRRPIPSNFVATFRA